METQIIIMNYCLDVLIEQINEYIDNFITECLTGYYKRMEAFYNDISFDIKDEMFFYLEMTESYFTEEEIMFMETELPIELTAIYKSFLLAYGSSRIECNEFTLYRDRYVVELFQGQELLDVGYLQFASGPCGDPICFDLKSNRVDGDFSIVVFNHDLVSRDSWKSRELLDKYREEVAESFSEFLIKMCFG